MRKLTIRFLLFLLVFAVQSTLTYGQSGRKLYVTMAHRQGGFGGTLISINTDGTGYSKLHSFDPPGGFQPQGGIILGTDGKLYGTTAGGGTHNYGVVYSIDKDGSNYSEFHAFGSPREDGVGPYCKLLQGSDGKLYGNTNQGGLYDQGTIFSIGTDGNSFSNLLRFDGDNGVTPYYVPHVQDANGVLYGITPGGGANHYYGVIYSIHTDGTGYTKLHDFAGSDGRNPFSLLLGSDGKLYGTTYGGGATGDGTIFSIGRDGTGFSIVYSFNAAQGDGASSGVLIQGSDGKLYGTTLGGGGILFSIHTDGSSYEKLHLFDRNSSSPYSIVENGDGKIYGVTQFGGGADDGGIIYSINKDGSDYQKLMDCVDSTGMFPTGILLLESVTSSQPKISQTIAFDSILTRSVDSGDFTLTATATSGLPVSFRSSDSTIASISGGTVTVLQAGSVIITASQSGNGMYYPAESVQRVLLITSQPPVINPPSGNGEPPGEGEPPKEVAVRTFPNPFSDHFTVEVKSNHRQEVEVEVTVVDFTGRVLDHGTGRTDQMIEFGSGYKPGLYIVQLSYGGKRKTMKLFKFD